MIPISDSWKDKIEKSFPLDHHASLMIPNSNSWNGFLYPTLSLLIDSYMFYFCQ